MTSQSFIGVIRKEFISGHSLEFLDLIGRRWSVQTRQNKCIDFKLWFMVLRHCGLSWHLSPEPEGQGPKNSLQHCLYHTHQQILSRCFPAMHAAFTTSVIAQQFCQSPESFRSICSATMCSEVINKGMRPVWGTISWELNTPIKCKFAPLDMLDSSKHPSIVGWTSSRINMCTIGPGGRGKKKEKKYLELPSERQDHTMQTRASVLTTYIPHHPICGYLTLTPSKLD